MVRPRPQFRNSRRKGRIAFRGRSSARTSTAQTCPSNRSSSFALRKTEVGTKVHFSGEIPCCFAKSVRLAGAGLCGVGWFTLPANGQQNSPASQQPSAADNAREAARQQILNSERWQRAQRNLNAWLSVQRLYSADEVAVLRASVPEPHRADVAGGIAETIDRYGRKGGGTLQPGSRGSPHLAGTVPRRAGQVYAGAIATTSTGHRQHDGEPDPAGAGEISTAPRQDATGPGGDSTRPRSSSAERSERAGGQATSQRASPAKLCSGGRHCRSPQSDSGPQHELAELQRTADQRHAPLHGRSLGQSNSLGPPRRILVSRDLECHLADILRSSFKIGNMLLWIPIATVTHMSECFYESLAAWCRGCFAARMCHVQRGRAVVDR